jgi:glycosyl transferase family 25
MLTSFDDIQHILYINLNSRTDRNEYMQTELAKLGVLDRATRFPAIAMPNLGAIGCSLSHLKCLQMAKTNQWTHVLILEDDVSFLNPSTLSQQVNTFLKNNSDNNWDVLLFGGNVASGNYDVINPAYIQIRRCMTTTAYLVNGHYLDTLVQNVKDGITEFVQHKHMKQRFAIDVYWMKLQERDRWFLITPLTVTQRADYSDIENAYTDYSQNMLTLPKQI